MYEYRRRYLYIYQRSKYIHIKDPNINISNIQVDTYPITSQIITVPWPTDEMADRGTLVGFYTGIAIAIPSGFGVALSILGNNTSSLVGVAISASLLPPAVNAGIFLAMAILSPAQYEDMCEGLTFSKQCCRFDMDCPIEEGAAFCCAANKVIDNGGLLYHSGYSFFLTIGNILCIWLGKV